MAKDLHGGMFDAIGDMNGDGKADMQDYHLWQNACENTEIGGGAGDSQNSAGSGGWGAFLVKGLVIILFLFQLLQWIVELTA